MFLFSAFVNDFSFLLLVDGANEVDSTDRSGEVSHDKARRRLSFSMNYYGNIQ